MFNSDIVYISQIIKIMMHPDSGLDKKDKVEILSKASKEPGLNLDNIDLRRARISFFEKIYLSLYKNKRYILLIEISEAILKFRGNS